MESLVDIFSGDAFSVVSLTEAINIVPIQYGRVNQLGLFQEESVSTTSVVLEFDNQVLNLIPSSPRGTPAPKSKTGKRTAKPLVIPRIALDDMLLPADIQNVRQFGSQQLETVTNAINRKLIALKKKHDITNEFLKCGALAGIITDADGGTLLNLFTEFGVNEQSVEFDFTDEDTVRGSCRDVVGKIEDELSGDLMTGVHALCSPGFFQEMISSPAISAAFANYQNMLQTVAGFAGPGANPTRDDVSKGFPFGGIFWEEYRGKSTYLNGAGASTSKVFIPADTARFFPMGTQETFKHWNAPADWMETVNTPGLAQYAKAVPDNAGRWVELLSQSNPLPICVRPRVLVKGTLAS